ncbi:MAG: high frequency lysogenization protein HflD [Mariprofundaceae bacterium]|nr:high frequency lysogenization protein HflD [Mariprofundaceae bacterium]
MSTHPNHPLRNRVLALAAMVQAAQLVQAIARKGMADSGEMQTCLGSILARPGKDGIHAGLLYESPQSLRTGLIFIQHLLSGEKPPADTGRVKEVMSYCATMMSLEKKLARDHELLDKLGKGITRIEKQSEYFGSVMHSNIIAAIAGLYGETISTMKPRIIVHGKPENLGQSSNTNKVRAMLLAGIRAAHLWRNQGGGHLQLLLRRRALAREASNLLREHHPA